MKNLNLNQLIRELVEQTKYNNRNYDHYDINEEVKKTLIDLNKTNFFDCDDEVAMDKAIKILENK